MVASVTAATVAAVSIVADSRKFGKRNAKATAMSVAAEIDWVE